tara:strand:- start:26023 stop:26739 length:717 start_codon:yes stop_codon:yes gene_type:complete
MPIGKGYTLLDRAIAECAYAGCHTIWITVNDNWQNLIKKRIGDYVEDPKYIRRTFDKFPEDSKRRIYVYYVPELVKFRRQRYGEAWGVINSAVFATRMSFGVGYFTMPSTYYAAFPMALYDPSIIGNHRANIKNGKTLYIEHEGQSIMTGHKMGFTFDYQQLRDINALLGMRRLTGNLSYKDVFKPLKFEGVDPITLPWYNEPHDWDGYMDYMVSEHVLTKPDIFMKKAVVNRIRSCE